MACRSMLRKCCYSFLFSTILPPLLLPATHFNPKQRSECFIWQFFKNTPSYPKDDYRLNHWHCTM